MVGAVLAHQQVVGQLVERVFLALVGARVKAPVGKAQREAIIAQQLGKSLIIAAHSPAQLLGHKEDAVFVAHVAVNRIADLARVKARLVGAEIGILRVAHGAPKCSGAHVRHLKK